MLRTQCTVLRQNGLFFLFCGCCCFTKRSADELAHNSGGMQKSL